MSYWRKCLIAILCFLYWAQPCYKFQTWFSGILHFPDVSVWCKWGPLELTFGFKLLVLLLPVFSLPITCKRRCFFCLWAIWLLQSFVWCSLRHLRHDQCCEISGFTEKILTNFSINPIKEFLLQRFSFFSASRLSIICGNITCAPKKRWLSVIRRNGVVFNAKFWLFSSYEWRNCTRRESAWIVCYFRPFH